VCKVQTQNKIFTDPESERDNPRTREPERERREAQQILLVAMEVDDVFIRLVEEARATLLLHQQQQLQLQQEKKRKQQQHQQEPSWAWVCMRLLSCCSAYPSGVTPAILLSDLFQDAQEKERLGNGWKTGDKNGGAAIRSSLTTVLDQQQKQQQLPRLPNMVTIDSIHEKKFVSLDSVLQVVILSVHLLPGTRGRCNAAGCQVLL